MYSVGDKGIIFEKYQENGSTKFGWMPATIQRIHANGYLTVSTPHGNFWVDDKEFVV